MDSSLHERGFVNKLLLPLIAVSILLAGAIGFGVWAYIEREDYKHNSDQKVEAAVQEAVEETRAEEAERYAEEAKEPLQPYTGPSQYGSVRVEYPKTWSAYTINTERGSTPVEWYLHPGVVPDTNDRDNTFALRVEVVSQSYDRVMSRFDRLVQSERVSVEPYSLPEVPDVVGSRVNGEVVSDRQGSMIVLPLRDRTLQVWTESADYLPDFENHILPNLSFSP